MFLSASAIFRIDCKYSREIFSTLAFPILFKKAKVEGYEYYNPKNVFIRAWEITKELFSITEIIQNGYQGSKIFGLPDVDTTLDTEL